MNTMDIANKLVGLCREGKNEEAHKTLYEYWGRNPISFWSSAGVA